MDTVRVIGAATLTLKDQILLFGNIAILGSSLQTEFFSLKISPNMCSRSTFKAQQFSQILTTWLKSYCMTICSFHWSVGKPGQSAKKLL